jgi:hypothetical protein
MNPLLIMPFLEWGGKLLERWFPDPAQKAQAEMEMMKLLQTAELSKILAQLEVNAKEAAHPSVWVAGWRPFIGWVCGCSFAYATILHPLLTWYGRSRGWPAPPTLDGELMLYVLGGMLGLGGYRTLEKVKGAA